MIWGWIGNPRTGKTLAMIIHGYKDHINKRKVYSYRLKTKFSELVTINDIMDFDIPSNSTLLLDEVHTLIDSRNTSLVNRLTSYFWTQSGKRDIKIYFTSQLESMVDLRLMDISDSLFKSSKIYSINREKRKKVLRGFMYQKVSNGRYLSGGYKLPIRNAMKFYSLYDSEQPIMPLELDATDTIDMKVINNLYNVSPTKNSFVSMLRATYRHIKYDDAKSVYEFLDNGMLGEAKTILNVKDSVTTL